LVNEVHGGKQRQLQETHSLKWLFSIQLKMPSFHAIAPLSIVHSACVSADSGILGCIHRHAPYHVHSERLHPAATPQHPAAQLLFPCTFQELLGKFLPVLAVC
jgi:hypothetical protein